MSPPRPHLSQTKITSFFHSRTPPVARLSAVVVAPPAPPTVTIAGSRRTRRSLLRLNLIKYNYHPSTNYRPIHSYPMVSPLKDITCDLWGHSLPTINPSQVFHVFLQNPKGLRLGGTPYALQHDLRLCHDYGVAALSLPETNSNWDLPLIRSQFSAAIHNTWHNSASTVSKSPAEFIADYQPGGTATLILDNWTSRVIDKGEAPLGLGRWTFMTLRGKAPRSLQ